MRKTMTVLAALMTIGLWCGPRPAWAQQESREGGTGSEKVPTQSKESGEAKAKGVQPYRLDFSVNELEDGKKINTRHYSMNLTEGDNNEIKIGTRVPVATTPPPNTQFQYMDVGTRIFSRLTRHGDEIQLNVDSEISNIDTTGGLERGTTLVAPVVRQIKIEGSTLLAVGRPILIGSVDDPNSKKQFQLEVTVTKLK